MRTRSPLRGYLSGRSLCRSRRSTRRAEASTGLYLIEDQQVTVITSVAHGAEAYRTR